MEEKEHIRRSHNVTMLLYHVVLPAKYRKKVFTEDVTKGLINICKEIEEQYEIYFLEIGSDEDHVHFMIQGLPTMTVSRLVTILKSRSSNYLYKEYGKTIRKYLWGGKLWTSRYYVNTVGAFAGEQTIRNYIRNQGVSEYEKRYEQRIDLGQLPLWGS